MSRIIIRKLEPADHDTWALLAAGYRDFYKTPTTDAEYETTWQRLLAEDDIFGLGAHIDGQLVGIAHYLFHTAIWSPRVCYLQDLFTDAQTRGQGVARALIDAIADRAREQGAERYYWLTQDHNATARMLYDKVARYRGFIRYDYSLGD